MSPEPAGGRHPILVLNCGSSSLKFGLFQVGRASCEVQIGGEVTSIGESEGEFSVTDRYGTRTVERGRFDDQTQAVNRVLQLFADHALPSPAAIGHRIVNGGPRLKRHCVIDDMVLTELKLSAVFAPLHTPQALKVLAAATTLLPNATQVACFDTAFHTSMPDVARVLAIPRGLEAHGVYRYGFHGLSCESIVHQLEATLPDRLVIAHLGGGASITAVNKGKSIDTTMGLTPTGGVMMGTRSGDIDPGVLLYLMREKNFSSAWLEDLVDRRSGLLGVSGVSSDMREVKAAAVSNPDARLAIDMFAYQVRKQVAAMIAALGGVDALVFTGGIGENDPSLRAAVCHGLRCMGLKLDVQRNRLQTNPLNELSASKAIHVLPSEEDQQIARHTAGVISTR